MSSDGRAMAVPVKSPMRILMTTDGIGGVWNYSIRLAGALEPYDVQIALATMGPALKESQRQEVRRLSHVQLYESTFKLEWMQDPWLDVDRAGRWLLGLAEGLKPDLVHLNGYVHAAAPWPCPTLVVGHSCVCSWFEAVRKSDPTPQWNEYCRRVRLGLSHAGLVTAPTAAALDSLHRHHGFFRSAGPVHNGLDDEGDYLPRSDDVVFTVGRLWDPAKNIAALDRAAPAIRLPVMAAGATGGPDGQRLSVKAVRHIGFLDQTLLRDWYHRAAVFVLPSLYEPFGLAALEAARAGCPLVLSDIPSLREIWADAAVFVEPENPEMLAHEVNRLLDDVSLRRRYCHCGLQRAQMYTLGRMAELYHRTYCDLLGRVSP
jgi:glycosyltransferase involved in cell wall biosynthesis